MKSFLHNVTSVILATLMLFTTMSFTLEMHYCGDSLIDFSLIQNVHNCGMEEQYLPNCENEISEKSCCTDKQVVIEGQDNFQITIDKLNTGQQVFVATLFYTYINLYEGLDKNILLYRDYKPPILIRDIHKLHETYLI